MSTITRRINQLLDRHSVTEGDLRSVVEEYESELASVNRRLGEASDLVRRGLRSEAMTIVGSSPSLIDRANELDLPRLDELIDLLDLYDLPPLSVVDTEAVEILGDAMVELQSIDGLLRRQRQLVLARAPLAWRLRTLRAIAVADPTSPHWIDDIVSHEKARLVELAAEVEQAVQSGDGAALASLQQELAADWQTVPPDRLRAAVTQKLGELNLANMQAELLERAGRIQQAIDQFDEAGCREAASQYQSLHKEIGYRCGPSAISTETEAIAQPGLDYLADLDAENARLAARASAIAKLESTMDRPDATVPQIESAYQKATSFDEPLPPELFNRYRATINDMQTRGKRRFQLAIGSAVAATLVIIGLLVSWQIRRNHATSVATVTGQLEQLLDGDSLDEAGKFVNVLQQTHPEIATDPKVSKLIARHESMTRAEAERGTRFDQQMVELEQLADDALDPTTISRLENEATTDDEKLRILKQRDRYEQFTGTRQATQTESLVNFLKEYGEELNDLSQQSFHDARQDELQRVIDRLDQINIEIQNRVRELPWASSSAKLQGDDQKRRLAALKTRLKDQVVLLIRSSDATEALLAADSLPKLKSRLQEFIEELPTYTQSAQYRETLDAAEFWDTADSWNRHLNLLEMAFNKRFDAATLSLVKDSDQSLADQCSWTPFAIPASVENRIELAEKRRTILSELDAFLDQSLFSQMISVTYSTKDGTPPERVFVYEAFYDTSREKFKISEKQTQTKPVEVIQTGDGAVEPKALRAPLIIETQPASTVVMMQKELENLGDAALADWDGVMLGWLAGLTKEEKMDATIREILVSQLLERIMEGSASKDKLTKINLALVARRGDWSNWYRPAPRSVQHDDLMRQTVIPALSTVYRERSDPRKVVSTLSQMQVTPIGIWDVFGKSTLKSSQASRVIHYWRPVEQLPSGTLLVVRRDANHPLKGQWIRFGELAEGRVKVTRTDVPMTAGEPIFLSAGVPSDVAGN